MRRSIPFRILSAVGLLVVGAGMAVAGDPFPAGDVVARTPVPSADRPHGEVVVLRRGAAIVVRSVLHSKVLRQVAGRIAGKERDNWPEGETGRADSDRYVRELGRLVAALPPVPAGAEGEARKRSVLIEFVLDPAGGRVVLAPAEVTPRPDGTLSLEAAGPLTTLELERGYVERNQARIVEDAFGAEAETVLRRLSSRPAEAPRGDPGRDLAFSSSTRAVAEEPS